MGVIALPLGDLNCVMSLVFLQLTLWKGIHSFNSLFFFLS